MSVQISLFFGLKYPYRNVQYQYRRILFSRAGSIIPDFLPGQIPDSGHVYEVYGVNQIILG